MTWKQIEASRERRLWISQVIIPIAGFVVTVGLTRPDLVESAKTKAKECADKIKAKFNK